MLQTLIYFLPPTVCIFFTMTSNDVPTTDDSGNYLNRFPLYLFQWHEDDNGSVLASYRNLWAPPSPEAPCCSWVGLPQPLGWVTAATRAHKPGGEPMNKMINICDETGCWGGRRRGRIFQLLNYWSYSGALTGFPCCKMGGSKQRDPSIFSFIVNNL